MSFSVRLALVCMAAVAFAAVTKKDRVIETKLSDEKPGTKEFDHEAFLGEAESQEFDKLPAEESRRRLGIIYDKIDKDNDGSVTEDELTDWIKFTQERYVRENTKAEFDDRDTDKDNKIQWDEYYQRSYGFLADTDWKDDDQDFSYKELMEKDRARWKFADLDGDNACTMEEYQAFLHPEEFEHMKEVVLNETLNDIDKDKDGHIDLQEYIGDMYRPEEPNEEEPDWVKTEKEQFAVYRDKNKDGKLDRVEVREWIMPSDYNHAHAEAAHLIHETDTDEDGVLSKEEVLEHQDVFVGSQATDWGEAFKRHDEF